MKKQKNIKIMARMRMRMRMMMMMMMMMMRRRGGGGEGGWCWCFWHNNSFLGRACHVWGDNARHKANGPQGDQKALLGWISVAIFLKACMCCLVSSQIILYKYELNQKVLKSSTDVETPPFKYTKMLQHDTAAGRSLRIRLSTSALRLRERPK